MCQVRLWGWSWLRTMPASVTTAPMAIGQTNAFTPIQMVTAISAVANGGYLMTPYVVDRINDKDGNLVEKTEPHVVRQVISEKTSKEMRTILEQVVSTGTGKKGQIEGYKVAGKTGTAQKVIDGKYAQNTYIVSFAGFAPADDPKVACIVIVDEPQHEKMGGMVAGPVFSSIMADTLRYLNVPKTVVNDDIQQPADEAVEKVIVPDLGQMNAMTAIDTFINMGLDPIVQTQGEDMYAYLPPAGTVVDKGSSVLLYCKNPNETAGVVPDLTGKSHPRMRPYPFWSGLSFGPLRAAVWPADSSRKQGQSWKTEGRSMSPLPPLARN